MTTGVRTVVRLATALIDPGPVRDRYPAELAADLHDDSGPVAPPSDPAGVMLRGPSQ